MQTIKNHYLLFLVGIILAGITSILLAVSIKTAYGNIADTQPAQTEIFQRYTFFSTSTTQYAQTDSIVGSTATTSTATSTAITSWFDSNGRKDNGYFVIAGAKKVNMYFTKQGATTTPLSTSVFKVEVTPDGTNWYPFNKMVLGTSTTKTTVSAIYQTGSAANATTTNIAALDLQDDAFFGVRCIVGYLRVSIDGENLCSATASF